MEPPLKRRKGIYEGDTEAIPKVDIPPNKATIILDSAQNPLVHNPLPSNLQFSGGLIGSAVDSTKLFPAFYPFSIDEKVPVDATKATVLSTGDTRPKFYKDFVSSSSNFSAHINPLTGCSSTKYFGAFTSNAEWDTHRGNSILSFRMFIEPNSENLEEPRFIYDFFIKLPDAIVFDGTILLNESRKIANMINYLLQNCTHPTGEPPNTALRYLPGWSNIWFSNNTPWVKDPAAPDASELYTPIRCEVNNVGQFFFKMDTSDAVMDPRYVGSRSTFVIFDHPNSITNRGGRWSGFGYDNPLSAIASSAELAFDPKANELRGLPYPQSDSKFDTIPPFTTYPLGGTLVEHNTLSVLAYELLNPDWPVVTNPVYNTIRSNLFNKMRFTGLGDRHKLLEPLTINWTEEPIRLFGAPNVISASRPPLLRDTRYLVHNSDEINFDSKLNPLTMTTLVGGAVGPTTFGVDFKTFKQPSVGNGSSTTWMNDAQTVLESGAYTSKAWGNSTYDGVLHNPNIFLAKNTSQMTIKIQTFNEYGEPLIGSVAPEGTGLRRNLLAGEPHPFPQGATFDIDTTFVGWVKFVYPSITGLPALPPFNAALRYPTTSPLLTLYRKAPGILKGSNTKFLTYAQSPVTYAFDELYYDNQARIAVQETIVHFFNNEMY